MAVRGRDEIIRNLQRYSKAMIREFEYELLRASSTMEMKAKMNAPVGEPKKSKGVPVDIGKLRQSIFHKVDDKNLTAKVGATEFYAPYVEFGTGQYVEVDSEFKDLAMEFYVNGQGKMRPRPFLIPAFYSERNKFIQNIKNIVRKYSA